MVFPKPGCEPGQTTCCTRQKLTIFGFGCALTLFAVTGYLSYVTRQPLTSLSVAIRLAAFFAALIGFLSWKNRLAIPLALMFFFMAFHQAFSVQLTTGALPTTSFTRNLVEIPPFLVTVLALASILYLWRHLSCPQKAREAQLVIEKAEREWSAAMDASEDACYILDLNRRVLIANKAFYNMTRSTPQNVIGRHIEEIVHPEGEEVPCPVCRAQEEKRDAIIVMEADHPDNPAGRPIEITVKAVRDDTGEPISIFMKLHDLTKQREIESDLRQSKEEWERTFDAIPDIVTLQDPDMHIVRANRAAFKFLEMEKHELLGKKCHEVFRGSPAPCPGCPSLSTLLEQSNHSEVIEHATLRKVFHITSSPILDRNQALQYLVHTAKDITKQKKLEEELFQAHKMEAIGTLAGGIAHDFNNILSAIIGFSELAKLHISAEDVTANEYLHQVLNSSRRASELVRQILTFSRKSPAQKESLEPHLIVKEAMKMLHSSLPTTITIQEDIDSDCGTILADPTNIHQIVVNLCINALHAMEMEQGTLNVSLHRKEIHAEDITEKDVSPGDFVVLSVSDTGKGMDDETLGRIFEPYFTTKQMNKGTGLGLALIHGIVKDCNGFIQVKSRLGQGSEFHIYFPAQAKKMGDSFTRQLESMFPPGNERILTVDDEESIVDIQKKFLERLGYEVTAVTDSREALDIFRAHPDNFDLLITDQTMPTLTGAALTEAVLQIKPSMPVILCTGYSSVFSEKEAATLGIRKFAIKPVATSQLAKIIREALDDQQHP